MDVEANTKKEEKIIEEVLIAQPVRIPGWKEKGWEGEEIVSRGCNIKYIMARTGKRKWK